ncbi:MAG: hypothetical protein HRT71_20080 [Flavobacteriales bacterium]|nr:hypothetical protein [Flavobacteriales bacterium]
MKIELKNIIVLLLFSIGIKTAYLIISVSVNGSSGNLFHEYVKTVKKNDSYWYQKIAQNGYPTITEKRDLGFSEGVNFKQSSWAFFPFYPVVVVTTSKYTGLTFDKSFLLWSITFSLFAILGTYWFGLIYFKDHSIAFLSALVLFSYPFAYYYSMFYTESMFFTFLIGSFISIHYQRYWVLALLLIPLTLLRPNGIVLLLPLYLYMLERNGMLEKFKMDWAGLFKKENIIRSAAFLTSPLVFFMYCFYQLEKTGFFLAFSIAQAGWYRELSFPIVSFFNRGDLATQFNSVFTIIVILFAFFIRKKLPISLNTLVFVSLLLPLCSGSVISMTRFVSIMFPLFLVLTILINQVKYKYLVVLAIFVIQFGSFYMWVINHPFSY